MKIGIDGRFLTHPQRGGFKTYITNLIRALAAIDETNSYTIFVSSSQRSASRSADAPSINLPGNFEVQALKEPFGPIGMPLREQVLLPTQIARRQLDVFHSPALTAPLLLGCPLVVTLHDTLWKRVESGIGLKRGVMQRYYNRVAELAAKRSTAIITVSHYARAEILENVRVAPERVLVVYESAGEEFERVTDENLLASIRDRYGIHGKFVIALGSADPRKNVSGLLEVFAALPAHIKQSHRLLIVWAHPRFIGQFQEKARTLGIHENLNNAVDVSNADLAALYSMASAFVFPSTAEGFGLPLLEAMRCGAPVVAADNSSIPEIGGHAAKYFSTHDIAAGAATLAEVLSDREEASRLQRAGYQRALDFSWVQCAEQTLDIYRLVSRR